MRCKWVGSLIDGGLKYLPDNSPTPLELAQRPAEEVISARSGDGARFGLRPVRGQLRQG